jgi:hypothetical protein
MRDDRPGGPPRCRVARAAEALAARLPRAVAIVDHGSDAVKDAGHTQPERLAALRAQGSPLDAPEPGK